MSDSSTLVQDIMSLHLSKSEILKYFKDTKNKFSPDEAVVFFYKVSNHDLKNNIIGTGSLHPTFKLSYFINNMKKEIKTLEKTFMGLSPALKHGDKNTIILLVSVQKPNSDEDYMQVMSIQV